MRARLVLMLAMTLLMMAGALTPASATPIPLTAAGWASATAGLPLVTETFENLSSGTYASPLTLTNGMYTATSPTILIFSSTFCGDSDSCLIDSVDLRGVRTFSAFPTGTTLWSSDLYTVVAGDISAQAYLITVVGRSGILTLNPTLGPAFLAFSDPTGLVSVSVMAQGTLTGGGLQTNNYSFDNVTTAAAPVVPEPMSLVLLGTGLIGAGVRRYRRKRH